MTMFKKIFLPAQLMGTADGTHSPPSIPDFSLDDCHALILGGTRRGKSGLLSLISRSIAARGVDGASLIDPHGSYARGFIEWLAHPSSGQHALPVHVIDPPSLYSIGLNPLRPHDDSWEAAHDAAITLTSVIESRFEASAEETPRLSRIVYVAGMLCARRGLTLIELLEVLSLGGEELRRSLLEDFDNRVVRRELEDLCVLASKNPREFLTLVESTKNRFVKWLGDRRLARILGQKNGLDLRKVMDNREFVIADLSALNYPDAALVGAVYTSMAFAAARRRPPLQCARHRLILDEAESLITLDVARMCDQSAKVGLNVIAAIQRLGQLRARDDFIADALLTNCALKICFGGLEAESARYVAENLFAGVIPLAEWKAGSERPTAVGQTKVILKNRTRSEQHAESEASSETDVESSAHAHASSSSAMFSSGMTLGSADSLSFVSMPPEQMLGSAPAISKTKGHNNSSVASTARGVASAKSSSYQYAHAHGRSTARGTSDATTIGEGESEALATVYENLSTQLFTLEEQLHKLSAELMTLPRREAFVRMESDAPFRARTADCFPAFRSAEFKAELLPRFLRAAAQRSRYAVLVSDVDRELATRIDSITHAVPASKTGDFSPEPMPETAARRSARELQRMVQGAPEKPSAPDDRPRLHVVAGGKDGDSK
jgi:type IV secretory system conjugative DNA transfer VirD4/TraG family protein